MLCRGFKFHIVLCIKLLVFFHKGYGFKRYKCGEQHPLGVVGENLLMPPLKARPREFFADRSYFSRDLGWLDTFAVEKRLGGKGFRSFFGMWCCSTLFSAVWLPSRLSTVLLPYFTPVCISFRPVSINPNSSHGPIPLTHSIASTHIPSHFVSFHAKSCSIKAPFRPISRT